MNRRCLIFSLISFFATACSSQQIAIIPQPVHVQTTKGSFLLSKKTVIAANDEDDRKTARIFNDYLRQVYGFTLYIDYIALHKMNYFHWHLTEDQGWRIEIKKYPNLTSIGAYRNGTIIGRYPGTGNDNTRYGGFYTQDEIKDVVQYAADRHITVIP